MIPIQHRKRKRDPPPYQLTLTPSSRDKIRTAIQNSLAPSTFRAYQSSINLFHSFCDRENIPHKSRTPTPELLLCAFAADGIGQLSGSTTRNRIAALKAWHAANNWTWYGSERLSRVVTGINKTTRPTAYTQRLPVTIRALEILARHLDPLDPFDTAVLACACTAFWGQCRLGELLPTTSHSSSLSLLPRRRSIRHSPGNHSTWVLNLPSTKTDHRGQDIPLVKQKGPTNPLRALHNHLQKNINPPHIPLFAITKNGTPLILTKKLFLDRCNQIWSRSAFPTLTGHSFRIGGTSHLLLSGVPPDIVKTMGRWSSDAFLRYWRSSEQIAPIYLKNVSTTYTDNQPTNSRHRRWG